MTNESAGNPQEHAVPTRYPQGERATPFELRLADSIAQERENGTITAEQIRSIRERLDRGERIPHEEARMLSRVESAVLYYNNPQLGELSQTGMNFWRITRANNLVEGKQQAGQEVLLIGGMDTYPEIMGLFLKPPTLDQIEAVLPTLSATTLAERVAEVKRAIKSGQKPQVTPPEYFSGHVVAVDLYPTFQAIEQAAQSMYQFPPKTLPDGSPNPNAIMIDNINQDIDDYLTATQQQFDCISWQAYPPTLYFSQHIPSLVQEAAQAGDLTASLPTYQAVHQPVREKITRMISHLRTGGRLQLIAGYGKDPLEREQRTVPLRLANSIVSADSSGHFTSTLTILNASIPKDTVDPADTSAFAGERGSSAILRIQRIS